MTIGSGGSLFPGFGSAAGTLSVGALSLQGGSILNLTLSPSSASSFVSDAGSLGLSTGTVSLNLADGGGLALGTYPFVSYAGALSGTTSFNVVNTPLFNRLYTVTSGTVNGVSYLDLIISQNFISGVWSATGGGAFSWATSGNWASGNIPTSGIDTATFGTSVGSGTATISLNGSRTLALMSFNTTGGGSYVLTASDSSTITMGNNGSPAPITVSGGSQTINVPVVLADNLSVTNMPAQA